MEAAKRREARRKKLLESSEDRFKRIERLKMRSQEVEDDHQDSGNIRSSGQALADDPSKSATMAPVSQPEEQRASVRQLLDGEEDSQTPSTKPPISSCHASDHHSVPCCPDNSGEGLPASRAETSTVPAGVSQNPIPRDVSQDSGCVDGALTPQNKTQPCDVNEIQHRSKAKTPAAQEVVSPQTLVFSLLAVVTRLWLVGLLQGQSIIVLFFATKVLLFYIGLEQSPVQSGPVRIITALLTFRGASPESVQRVLRCLGFFQGTLRDFSTFIFVFVMVHATMQWSFSPVIDQSESVPEF